MELTRKRRPSSERNVSGQVLRELGMRHAVRLLQSTLAQVPVVVGYFRPVILLPVSMLTRIPTAQL